jgi:assimilatory nitrate reductase catalytic subunit
MNAPSPQPPAVRTTCPYCGVGCGVLAQPDGYGGATIAGDSHHPANFGHLCSKG